MGFLLQDTMIALQALAEYAIATRNTQTDLRVTLSGPADGETAEFRITNEDKNREYIQELVRAATFYLFYTLCNIGMGGWGVLILMFILILLCWYLYRYL